MIENHAYFKPHNLQLGALDILDSTNNVFPKS